MPELTHILGEALRQNDLVTFFDKVAKSVRIIVHVTSGKALVRHVEEREHLLLFDDLTKYMALWNRIQYVLNPGACNPT